MATNDPLQTFFQLMSGRIPQAAQVCEQQAGPIAHLTHLMTTTLPHLRFPLLQSCGDARWGDWRPHLAVLLSNKVGDLELNHRAIVTMGDTLGELRLLEKENGVVGLEFACEFGGLHSNAEHMLLFLRAKFCVFLPPSWQGSSGGSSLLLPDGRYSIWLLWGEGRPHGSAGQQPPVSQPSPAGLHLQLFLIPVISSAK